MKNIAYKNITIFLLFVIFIILNTGKSKAVLQANGNTSATYNLSDWMINVRQMEQLGGAMGLTETLNDNLTSSSDSNNIDVHMEKNTEYGALAILSASSYGNPNKVEDGETTTGNATGVVIKLNNEWVAASSSGSATTNFKNAVNRYKNIYKITYEAKLGDAVLETKGWHGTKNFTWGAKDGNAYNFAGVVRALDGVFSYHSYYWDGGVSNPGAYYNLYNTRAVVVSGERSLKKRKENEYNNEKNKKLY